MFHMSLFPQSGAVQQTMCEHVNTHIYAAIQMGGRRAPSEMIIDQEQTQRDFIAENLDKQSEKSIDQLQKAWSDQQKLHDLNIPETKRRNRSKIDRVVTDEQRVALDEEYYGFFRGSVGMSTLWKTFNENNERQNSRCRYGGCRRLTSGGQARGEKGRFARAQVRRQQAITRASCERGRG